MATKFLGADHKSDLKGFYSFDGLASDKLFEREKNSHYIETPVCEVRHTPERKTTIDGFLVTYEYNGQYYQTRTKVKPGTMIKIVIKHEVQ